MRLALAILMMCPGCDYILHLDKQGVPSDGAVVTADSAPPDGVGGSIMFVQGHSFTASSSQDFLLASPAQQSGDLDVIIIGWTSSTTSVNAVTDSAGNAYRVGAPASFSNGLGQTIYYAEDIIGGGSNNVTTVAFNSSATDVDVRMLEYKGLAPSNSFDATVSLVGAGVMMSTGQLTTTHPHTLVVAGFMAGAQTTGAGTECKERVLTASGNLAEDCELFQATTTTAATAMQSQNAVYVGQAVAFVAK